MKNQRLDYALLVDSLKDRRLVDPEALTHILHQCESTGALLTTLLVMEGLITDWELARVTSEVFGLPFLPLETYEPNAELIEKLDPNFLRQYLVVPLDRFGKLVTVAMPGMVPGEVLAQIENKLEAKVMPVVGSVNANLRWLEEHLPPPEEIDFGEEAEAGAWVDVLDMGEQAVMNTLSPEELDLARQAEEELASTLELFDLAEEEFDSPPPTDVEDIASLAGDLEMEIADWKKGIGDSDQEEAA